MCRQKHCRTCGIVLDGVNEQFHKVVDPARGYYYYCTRHAEYMAGYSSNNPQTRGEEKKHGFSGGLELEIGRATWNNRPAQENLLYRYGFLPSEDGTVRCEWKSPIYHSFNPLPKMFRTVANMGFDLTNNCGTHVCIGHVDYINATTIQYIKRFYHTLFLPFSEYLEEHEEECIKVYGRSLNGHWATPLQYGCNPMEHTNFINIQHNTHIEFRVCKLNSEKNEQFMNMFKLNRDIVSCIIENFIKHFNDTSHKGMNETEYRIHKAQITSQKIVKLFKKYADMNY